MRPMLFFVSFFLLICNLSAESTAVTSATAENSTLGFTLPSRRPFELFDTMRIHVLQRILNTVHEAFLYRQEKRLYEVFNWRTVLNYRNKLYRGTAQIHVWYCKLIFEDRVTDIGFVKAIDWSHGLSSILAQAIFKVSSVKGDIFLDTTIRIVLDEDLNFFAEGWYMTDIQPKKELPFLGPHPLLH
ncbi:unnamed protein product [Caenorhabditis auriculariae]|uniref:Uncharacterized protein n=1 Tax=Caenorhabditis auriculariae TaxID=2777116 RepID=A0A8S1H486_9PELO|nr:unnamed protein product [Caenorhabditis auriculariae]